MVSSISSIRQSVNRWTFFYCGPHIRDRFLRCIPGTTTTSDIQNYHSPSFRTHVAWSKARNRNVKDVVVDRYLRSTGFITFLLRATILILFSPSEASSNYRERLKSAQMDTLDYWIGISLSISLFISVFALLANYTAYDIFNSVSHENAPIIFRSSVGRYASQLPSTLINWQLKCVFLTYFLAYMELKRPESLGGFLAVFWLFLFGYCLIHNMATSQFIMTAGALGSDPILQPEEEQNQTPEDLTDRIIERIKLARKAKIPLKYQYRIALQQVLQEIERGEREARPLEPKELGKLLVAQKAADQMK